MPYLLNEENPAFDKETDDIEPFDRFVDEFMYMDVPFEIRENEDGYFAQGMNGDVPGYSDDIVEKWNEWEYLEDYIYRGEVYFICEKKGKTVAVFEKSMKISPNMLIVPAWKKAKKLYKQKTLLNELYRKDDAYKLHDKCLDLIDKKKSLKKEINHIKKWSDNLCKAGEKEKNIESRKEKIKEIEMEYGVLVELINNHIKI